MKVIWLLLTLALISYCQLLSLEREQAVLQVTRDEMPVYLNVDRFCRNSDDAEIVYIVLAGGPGMFKSVEFELADQLAKHHDSLCVYYMDHRCVEGPSAVTDLESDAHHCTITNAAKDVLHLVKRLKMTHLADAKMVLWAFSYGGMVAQEVLQMTDQFEWAILDSPSMLQGRFDEGNDEAFWNWCVADEQCSVIYDRLGHVGPFKNLFVRVMDPNDDGGMANSCWSMVQWHGVDDLLTVLVRRDPRLVFPFLLHVHHCPNPGLFQQLLDKIVSESVQLNQQAQTGNDVNRIVNGIIACSEIFAFGQPVPQPCTVPMKSLIQPCVKYWHYTNNVCPTMAHRLYEYPGAKALSSLVERTRVILLTGGMDLVSGMQAQRHLLSTSSKHLHVHFDAMGHLVSCETPCLKYIVELVQWDQMKRRDLMGIVRRLTRCKREMKTDAWSDLLYLWFQDL